MGGMRAMPLVEVRGLLGRLTGKYAALVAVCVTCGCRVSEALALRRGDLLDASGALRRPVRFARLKAHGGVQSREAEVPAGWDAVVLRHLSAEAERGWTRASDWVFRGQGGRALSRFSVYRFFRRTLGQGRGTHWMRKTFAQELYSKILEGMPGDAVRAAELVRRALGHERLDTTMKYLGIQDGILRSAREEAFRWE